jgi:putative proteasome-type protease
MTFCTGILVRDGLLALADTKIVKGEEHLTRGKLSSSVTDDGQWWLMTSGLRSVRDKAVTYLDRELAELDTPPIFLYELANRFGAQLRRVRDEDGPSLAASNFTFNLHAILGGQMSGDAKPRMYYIYPEGNWIESTDDSPYFIIGRTHYAKPILDRLLTVDTPLRQAVALAFLAFDATKASVTDVGYPIDLLVCEAMSRRFNQRRFEEQDLGQISAWWRQALVTALADFPFERFDRLLDFSQFEKGFDS